MISAKRSKVNEEISSSKPQHTFTAEGVNICFPYEPYKVQVDYIVKLLQCLQKRENGLLESPTGTGKTLSLLCGALAWLEHQRAYQQLSMMGLESNQGCNAQQEYQKGLANQLGKAVGSFESQSFGLAPTKVIYSSRTHSQLSQVVKELKKTSYNRLPAVVLGSRDQLCLLPEVANLENNGAKLHACRARVKARSCQFYLNVEQKVPTEPDFRKPEVMDIEDLMKLGTKHRCCPYYTAKEMKKKADVIFAPYNYLIDPKTRKAQSIELQNNVIIFDEAHNIESVCEDGMSFQIKSKDIACSISELTKLLEKFANLEKPDAMAYSSPVNIDVSIDDLASLKVMLTEVETILDKEAFVLVNDNNSVIKNGSYIHQVLGQAGINANTAPNIQTVIEQVLLHVNENQTFAGNRASDLLKFSEMLEIVFAQVKSGSRNNFTFDSHYKVCISLDKFSSKTLNQEGKGGYHRYTYHNNPMTNEVLKKNHKNSWKLDCWCLSPERSMQDLMDQGIHCMVLTSGTLSPLKSFQAELGIPFPIQLENPHIINPDQVLIAVVKKGPDGTELLANFKNRGNPIYVKSLGMAISNFCTSIPKGMLVFFPSYSVMSSSVELWKNSALFMGLNNKKNVFIEPRTKDSFYDCMEQYSNCIEDESSKGGVLFGVCRGKISEGLDFANDHARGVVITGVPFAPFFDDRVKLKKQYLNEHKEKGLSGDEWYMLQAIRAVNQAIGRVIRHKDDYGVVLLCDIRFERKDYTNQLSKWVRGHVKTFNNFGLLQKSLFEFFKRHKAQPSSAASSNNALLNEPSTSKQISYKLTSLKTGAVEEESHNLLNMYGGGFIRKKSAHISKKVSVFDAINLTEDGNRPQTSGKASCSINKMTETKETSPPLSKKRKISVAPANIFGDGKSEEVKQKPNLDDKSIDNVKAKIKDFLNKVKEMYGKEGQLRLSKAVDRSIKFHNAEHFIEEMVYLTTNMENKEDIFKTVVILLPREMRNGFIAEITRMFKSKVTLECPFVRSDKPPRIVAFCAFCMKIVQKGKGSASTKCWHLCCFICWEQILKTSKKCPICQVSIKKRHVKRNHGCTVAPLRMQNFLNPEFPPEEIRAYFNMINYCKV